MERRTSGLLLMALGASVEVLGASIEVWQDRDIYTILPSVTLPTLVAMVLGVPVLSRGYRRYVRALGPTAAFGAVATGSAVGISLWALALWWQLAKGLPCCGGSLGSGDLDLDIYAAAPVLFVGTGLLAQGVASLTARGWGATAPTQPATGSVRPSGSTAAARRRAGLAASLSLAGFALVAFAVVSSGWVDRQVTGINSLYLLVTVEIGGTGAWFLLVGFAGTVRNLPPGARQAARTVGAVTGTGTIVGGTVWWWEANLPANSILVATLALLVSGLGILLLSLEPTEGHGPLRSASSEGVPAESHGAP